MTRSGVRAPIVAWVAATSSASLLVLVLVLELGGGAPAEPPASLPDPGRVPAWATALLPLLGWGAAISMVGPAMVASGVLGVRHPRAARHAGVAGLVLSGVALAQLGAFAWELDGQAPVLESVQARGFFAQAILALLAGLLGILHRTERADPVLLMAALVAIIPPLLTGHARTASNTVLTSVALVIHAIAATVWIGGLLGLCWMALREGGRWPAAVRRFSPLALGCVLAIGVSGIVTMLGHLSFGELLTSSYGAVIVLKAVVLAGLAAFGSLQRRYVVRRGGSPRRAFVLVAGCELVVMALAIALATGLAQTPPPS